MKAYQVPATLTAANFHLNAFMLAHADMEFNSATYVAQAEKIANSENLAVNAEDSIPQQIVSDYKSPDAVEGKKVVGLCDVATIKKEFENYQIFHKCALSTDATKVLFRGTIKTGAGNSEYYTPDFLSDNNLILA